MRIWSLHPRYLDAKGLVALWRESLLARHVLQGRTKGYTRHPQLVRFKELALPVEAMDQYLTAVLAEAVARGYRFDASKIGSVYRLVKVPVSRGQLAFERSHLLNKLTVRDPSRVHALEAMNTTEPHPLFAVVAGGVATWEKG